MCFKFTMGVEYVSYINQKLVVLSIIHNFLSVFVVLFLLKHEPLQTYSLQTKVRPLYSYSHTNI